MRTLRPSRLGSLGERPRKGLARSQRHIDGRGGSSNELLSYISKMANNVKNDIHVNLVKSNRGTRIHLPTPVLGTSGHDLAKGRHDPVAREQEAHFQKGR